MTTREDIARWFDEAKDHGAAYLLVVCDTFDHSDYPVKVKKEEDFWTAFAQYNKEQNMSRIMEVYNMSLPREEQLEAPRAWNPPAKEPA